MASHTTISPQEAADRLAIRELVDAYAHCADRRDAKGQMALFTTDTRFLVFMDPTAAKPTQELHGRESLAPVFDNLNTYAATMHFNGQSTVSLDGDRATGESYCLAHHLAVGEDGAHDDDRIHPLPRRIRQAGRRMAVRRAAADGQLDRNTAIHSVTISREGWAGLRRCPWQQTAMALPKKAVGRWPTRCCGSGYGAPERAPDRTHGSGSFGISI